MEGDRLNSEPCLKVADKTAKKSILFIMPYMSCGGTESALLSLFNILDRDEYDITLLLLAIRGDFIDRIPEDIRVENIEIPEKEQGVFLGKKQQFKGYASKGRFVKAIKSLIYNSRVSITEDREQMVEYFSSISDSIPKLERRYDLAVDYFGYASFTTFYLAEKVDAGVKATWVHSIISNARPQPFLPYYQKMDYVVAVSSSVRDDFQSVFPSLDNVVMKHNEVDEALIRQKAREGQGFSDEYDGIRILTVGRVSEEKGQDLAIKVLKRLIREGYRVRWYFIGPGDEAYIERLSGLLEPELGDEHLRFLGFRENPYPYMDQCDIYVQPSYVEGYCLTTSEAKALCRPVVTTDVAGAREQFVDGETAIIVHSDEESLYEGVKRLLDDPSMRLMLQNNLAATESFTTSELQSFFRDIVNQL